MRHDSLLRVGQVVVDAARQRGAAEVSARLSRSVWTEVGWRDGRMEKCQESRSLLLQVSLLVDDRYSAHRTSDLRPEGLMPFLQRAVEATRVLEPDRDRRLADRALMGIAELPPVPDADAVPSSDERRAHVRELEDAIRQHAVDLPLRSAASHTWDGFTETALVCSNGFSGSYGNEQVGRAADLTLTDEGGRLPEAHSFVTARRSSALPGVDTLAADVVGRARRRLGSKPVPSGRYPMLVQNDRVGRLLGLVLGPLMGQALFEGRSCFADSLDRRLAPEGSFLYDDPHVPEGLATRPFDLDGLPTRRLPILEDGVLSSYFLDIYHARRLDRAHTTGQPTNLTVPAGQESPDALAAPLPQVLRVEGFIGGNANSASGSFSLGVFGTLLEHGIPSQHVSEMNISGNLFELLERWVASADDVWRYGSVRAPSLLFDRVQFSGS